MATFIQFRTPYSSLSAESCSTSDCSTTASFSDEEVMLASRNPKKRAGRKKFRETRHPVYRGVRRRDSGKWVCEIREPNKKTRVWLGTYLTAEMAARAHDVAVLAMKGRSACLNFADSLWRLPIPESSNVKDILKAALEAAEAFRPAESNGAEMEETKEFAANALYMDEEEIFGMPGFLANMAEGLMLPPPMTVGYDNCEDEVDFSFDASLWSF
ncbi:hypothetical protein L2E82_31750 [Cichorium intybus]|uniref:Uncharacterized protein n=2 Tax=Cichorium intybus TaxID=13427 RepID=A0ACB9BET3_CICIN|nr:hypothetical protein L2E82_31749 [Cichorium intybus]KAI3720757.1 hypothetical protein L2E82_31750 [Cichorium intybus]